jgi:murein DD-endopeptidase MepM/ murein hydrolase activator NlpD
MPSLTYILILFTIFICSSFAFAYDVKLSSFNPIQGQTLVVWVTNIDNRCRYSCWFNAKKYPLYPIEKDTLRALIGIPPDFKVGRYAVLVVEYKAGEKIKQYLPLHVKKGNFSIQKIKFTPEKKKLIEDIRNKQERKLIITALSKETHIQQWEGKFSLPAKGKISSDYGTRRIDEKGNLLWIHKGIDIAAKEGNPVLAANTGRVILSREDFLLHGKTIIIDHGQGVMSLYLHLSSIFVKEGELVTKNQQIGTIGSTGLTNAPNLHFGIYIHRVPVNPITWLEKVKSRK